MFWTVGGCEVIEVCRSNGDDGGGRDEFGSDKSKSKSNKLLILEVSLITYKS